MKQRLEKHRCLIGHNWVKATATDGAVLLGMVQLCSERSLKCLSASTGFMKLCLSFFVTLDLQAPPNIESIINMYNNTYISE